MSIAAARASPGVDPPQLEVSGHQPESRYTKTKIDVIQFDRHFNYSDRDILVKIDVEGHEPEVIAGMRCLLADNRCHVQVEVFDANLGAVEDLLGKLGYAKILEFGYDRIFSNRPQDRQRPPGPG